VFWETPLSWNSFAHWNTAEISETAVSLQQLHPSQCGDAANPNGCWIVDFGENMAGVVRVKVRGGSRGQRVTLRFGELVHGDGSLNVNTSNNAWKDLGECGNMTSRPGEQMDVVVLSGEAEQEWQPLFVYHGFRYMELALESSPSSLQQPQPL